MRTEIGMLNRISEVLASLRQSHGYTKTKMAELMGVDKRTWSRWESGENSPSIVDFFMIYDRLGESPIRVIVDLYFIGNETDTESMRKEIAEYFLERAPEHQVRACHFLMHGPHGSDIDAQLEEFCAIDHLPVHYRYFVAEQIYIYYMLARKRGELILTDNVMPDMEAFAFGLKSVQKAAFDNLQK